MKTTLFSVHTDKGIFLIHCNKPDDASAYLYKKHPGIIIKKVKAKKGKANAHR